jgi:hypothetical protein
MTSRRNHLQRLSGNKILKRDFRAKSTMNWIFFEICKEKIVLNKKIEKDMYMMEKKNKELQGIKNILCLV